MHNGYCVFEIISVVLMINWTLCYMTVYIDSVWLCVVHMLMVLLFVTPLLLAANLSIIRYVSTTSYGLYSLANHLAFLIVYLYAFRSKTHVGTIWYQYLSLCTHIMHIYVRSYFFIFYFLFFGLKDNKNKFDQLSLTCLCICVNICPFFFSMQFFIMAKKKKKRVNAICMVVINFSWLCMDGWTIRSVFLKVCSMWYPTVYMIMVLRLYFGDNSLESVGHDKALEVQDNDKVVCVLLLVFGTNMALLLYRNAMSLTFGQQDRFSCCFVTPTKYMHVPNSNKDIEYEFNSKRGGQLPAAAAIASAAVASSNVPADREESAPLRRKSYSNGNCDANVEPIVVMDNNTRRNSLKPLSPRSEFSIFGNGRVHTVVVESEDDNSNASECEMGTLTANEYRIDTGNIPTTTALASMKEVPLEKDNYSGSDSENEYQF
ncbi:hypothetical protein RFI_24777 [Reticulomyxa filosa]|uniref:Uncharacterized protein n=1 Tax=Reticulomyxa filosa TaxID=46433 RepID=X6MEZ7_RETFI|nr:hypothetical protein RFI_24777 [Reticulomyxa filosa]|eukprot:ETO12598.1 hypothetical protein RFI_24777 [Reticulomyxa filosa]